MKLNSKEFSYIVHLAMSGCCGVFAIELSKAFGYEIIGFVDQHGWLSHFCCRSEQGLIDANGYGLTINEVSERYIHHGTLSLALYSIQEVEKLLEQDTGLGALDPPGYRAALQSLFKSEFWLRWQEKGRALIDKNSGTQHRQIITN